MEDAMNGITDLFGRIDAILAKQREIEAREKDLAARMERIEAMEISLSAAHEAGRREGIEAAADALRKAIYNNGYVVGIVMELLPTPLPQAAEAPEKSEGCKSTIDGRACALGSGHSGAHQNREAGAFRSWMSPKCEACNGKGGRWGEPEIDQWYSCEVCGGSGDGSGGGAADRPTPPPQAAEACPLWGVHKYINGATVCDCGRPRVTAPPAAPAGEGPRGWREVSAHTLPHPPPGWAQCLETTTFCGEGLCCLRSANHDGQHWYDVASRP